MKVNLYRKLFICLMMLILLTLFTVLGNKLSASAGPCYDIDFCEPSGGDYTNPTLSGISNYAVTKSNVTIQAYDNVGIKYIKYSTNGGSTWSTSYTTSITFSGSTSNYINYMVKAYDTSNNVSSTLNFTIDKVYPQIYISTISHANVTFEVYENYQISKVEYRRTNSYGVVSSWTNITDSGPLYTISGYPGMDTLVDFKVTDKAGNVSTYQVSLDRTAPGISLVGVNNGGATKTDVTVSSSAADLKYFYYNINNGSTINIYPNTSATFTSTGDYKVVASDGNNSTTVTFTIDKEKPTVYVDKTFSNGSVNVTSSDNKQVSYVLERKRDINGTWSAWYQMASNYTVTGPIGTTYYEVKAVDYVGNESNVVAFTIDNKAPVFSLDIYFHNDIQEYEIRLDVGSTINEVLDRVTATDERDGDRTSYISVIGTYDLNIAGNYRITLSVADTAGNVSTTYPILVRVVPQGLIAPIFHGLSDMDLMINSPEPDWRFGITANSFLDGDLTNQIYAYFYDSNQSKWVKAAHFNDVDVANREAKQSEHLINMSVAGSYLFKYVVTDKIGITTEVTRRVNVTANPLPNNNLKTITNVYRYTNWLAGFEGIDVPGTEKITVTEIYFTNKQDALVFFNELTYMNDMNRILGGYGDEGTYYNGLVMNTIMDGSNFASDNEYSTPLVAMWNLTPFILNTYSVDDTLTITDIFNDQLASICSEINLQQGDLIKVTLYRKTTTTTYTVIDPITGTFSQEPAWVQSYYYDVTSWNGINVDVTSNINKELSYTFYNLDN